MARKTARGKIPEGYSNIEPVLKQFQQKLKEAESKPVALNKPKNESMWEIYKLNHQRSRYVFDVYYKKKIISRDLFAWLLKHKMADKDLISKWKKQGYEKLCCVGCISADKVCICRVPKTDLEDRSMKCVTCGCNGCSSTD